MIRMKHQVAIVGAGVSGLTCGLVFAEHGYRTAIFAKEIGQQTTSGAAAALWFPYDAEPADKVIPWALGTCRKLIDLARNPDSGVSMIELRQLSRTEKIHIPDWAIPLGARAVVPSLPPVMPSEVENGAAVEAATRPGAERTGRERIRSLKIFKSGFSLRVPLMYAIPRRNDCVLGGTNELSNDLAADSATTMRIVTECTRALKIEKPNVLGERVGLRPFRKSGVRVERDQLRNGRTIVHNYGHGGSGFTLSWGCAERVFELATDSAA